MKVNKYVIPYTEFLVQVGNILNGSIRIDDLNPFSVRWNRDMKTYSWIVAVYFPFKNEFNLLITLPSIEYQSLKMLCHRNEINFVDKS